MHHTIFDTPVVNAALRLGSRWFLKLTGWTVEGALPADLRKCVLIAAPHTSNWDLPYTLMIAFVLRLNVYWMGKATIFKYPFRGVMMWLGGLPVERGAAANVVGASAQAIVAADQVVQLLVAPEGTRSKVRYWKTGFYYIALEAKVPIMLAYVDYARKVGGLGPVVHPTGDYEADMVAIKAFYAPITGRRPERFEA